MEHIVHCIFQFYVSLPHSRNSKENQKLNKRSKKYSIGWHSAELWTSGRRNRLNHADGSLTVQRRKPAPKIRYIVDPPQEEKLRSTAYGMDGWMEGREGVTGVSHRVPSTTGGAPKLGVRPILCIYTPGGVDHRISTVSGLAISTTSVVHFEEVPSESINLESASRENRSAKCEWYVALLLFCVCALVDWQDR